MGEAGGDLGSFVSDSIVIMASGLPGVDAPEAKGSGGICVGVEGLERLSESDKSLKSPEVERPECERVVGMMRVGREEGPISEV